MPRVSISGWRGYRRYHGSLPGGGGACQGILGYRRYDKSLSGGGGAIEHTMGLYPRGSSGGNVSQFLGGGLYEETVLSINLGGSQACTIVLTSFFGCFCSQSNTTK